VYSFQTDGGKFLSAVNGGGGDVHADQASMPRESEWFTITRNPNDAKQVHIRARNGMYLQVGVFWNIGSDPIIVSSALEITPRAARSILGFRHG
jgi:hypothetical protein